MKQFLSFLLLVASGITAMGQTLSIGCDSESSPNQWIAFRKDVVLNTVPSQALASIAVDSKYWLWVNGRMVVFEGELKRGPRPDAAYYDEVDLAPFLKKGENKIALLLWYFGKDAMSHKSSGLAQLQFQCPAIGVVSDANWLCRIHPAYGKARCPEPNWRLPESSIGFDARKDISGWQTGPTDGFTSAVVRESTLGALYKRPVPQWKDYGIKKAKIERRPGVVCDTVIAYLPHNMQMTPILTVQDAEGGHSILIETDHARVGEECVRAEYITRPGRQEYESLGWMNGMKIILSVEHGAKVVSVKYRETGFDTFPEGRFSCSEPFFNRFWEKGLRTIYVNARDTFFDCPDRERSQWWGDIVTILGECFYTYSTSLHSLVRKGIHELLDWQRPNGKIGAPIPGIHNGELPCQMLAAVGKYGIWTYYMNTGDRATIEHVYPAIKKYLARYSFAPDGMIEYYKGDWNWGDWGENRDMHLLQAMWYCLALEGVANMGELLGHADEARTYRAQLESLKAAINRLAWTGEAYRHPDYKELTDDRVQALAVVAGIAGPDKYEAIYKTLRNEEHASPYMEKYVMEALFCIGHGDYALERTRKRYDFTINLPDYDTLFEGWDFGGKVIGDGGSVNHAWSGGPLAVLPAKMLGLYPLEGGWKRFAVRPNAVIFDKCSLTFPTVSGTVGMTFNRKGNGVTWTIQVPQGTTAEVAIPWSYSRCTVDGKEFNGREMTLGEGRHKIQLKL